MKRIALILAVCVMSGPAFATCKSDAADKKLAGAALKSAVTKCTKDATATCAADAKEKKLAGAAKKSHMKKCVADAVGTLYPARNSESGKLGCFLSPNPGLAGVWHFWPEHVSDKGRMRQDETVSA